jgi:hypothetical protein
MTQISQGFKIVNELTWQKCHQTMIVINVSNSMSEKFIERSNRFITSVNRTETIKADVFIAINGNLIHIDDGDSWREYSDKLDSITNLKSISNKMIKDFATSSGYVQFCILESTDIV